MAVVHTSELANDEFYRRFFDEAPDMFACVDAKTARVKACNKTLCDVLGYSESEIVGKEIYTFYAPNCLDEVHRVFESFVKHGRAESPHLELLKANGSRLTVSLRVSSSKDKDGNIVESRSVWRDITLLKKVEQLELELRIQELQKIESLALLAGNIAHDFNNLLSTILGNANLGRLELPNQPQAQKKFEAIEIAAERAADLTQQLLAYAGLGVREQSVFDLTRVVEEMGHLLEVTISKKARLVYRLDYTGVGVRGDVTQIRQVIMNLLTNSSEALGGRCGTISVRTGQIDADRQDLDKFLLGAEVEPGPFGFVEVSDTGEGLSKEAKKKMFDPFYTTKAEGHGLGLAAVLGIIRAHRGTIRVQSQPESGTKVKVLFPALDSGAITVDRSEKNRQGNGESILVVDDEDQVRSYLRQVLEKFGFKVATGSDGRNGLNYFLDHHHEVDLVLMDITMPQLDGIEAFKAMNNTNPSVPVVLMSGYSEQAVNSLKNQAIAGFLQKPFTAKKLLEVITGLLD